MPQLRSCALPEIPPSVREIVNEFDLCSTSTAIYWLKKMTGAGLLRREPGAIRGIFVTLEGYKIARISAASRKKLLNKVAIQFAMLSNAMVPTTIVFEGKTLEMSFKEIGNDHSPE